MADLAVLNEELEKATGRHNDLRMKYPGAVMPEDARIEDDELVKRMGIVRNMIEEEKQKRRDAEAVNTQKYVDDPLYELKGAVNDDADGYKSLNRAGWEVKSGYWFKQTSFGPVKMFPEEVLQGAIHTGSEPGDAEAAHFVKQTRATIQPEYRNAWVKWFKNAKIGSGLSYSMLEPHEQKALSEGQDGAGGFTVPPDVSAEIGGRRAQVSVMRQLATVGQTMRDIWRQPMIKANATAATRNIYTDDFVGAWVGETPSQASIDAVFEMWEIPIRKIRAYCLLGNDLIADSVGNLVSELAQRGGKNIALVEDKGFIQGSGTGLEPLGFLSHPLALTLVASGGMATDVEGTTANTISNTISDMGSFPKIKNLAYSLPAQYAGNGTWLGQRATQGHIAGLVDANGRPQWNSYLDSGFTRPNLIIESAPFVQSDQMGADGTVSAGASTIPLAFADFSEYRIIERMQMSIRVLTERFGDTDQTGLFLFERVGGGLWNYDAFRTGTIYS